jgi:CheY-like chemotaxis protein
MHAASRNVPQPCVLVAADLHQEWTAGISMNEKLTILLVDDNPDDLSFVKHACGAAHFTASLQTVHSGEEAITYLKGEGAYSNRDKFPLPRVILLDLDMPKLSGFDVLSWVRAQPVLKRLWIIVLTASAQPEDVERVFELRANSYLVKPKTMPGLVAMMCCLRDWLEYNRFPSLVLKESN